MPAAYSDVLKFTGATEEDPAGAEFSTVLKFTGATEDNFLGPRYSPVLKFTGATELIEPRLIEGEVADVLEAVAGEATFLVAPSTGDISGNLDDLLETAAGTFELFVLPAGWVYVTLEAPLAPLDQRVSSTPEDLEPGWVIAYDTHSGAVEIFTDASFSIDLATTTSFDFRVNNGEGFGDVGTQSITFGTFELEGGVTNPMEQVGGELRFEEAAVPLNSNISGNITDRPQTVSGEATATQAHPPAEGGVISGGLVDAIEEVAGAIEYTAPVPVEIGELDAEPSKAWAMGRGFFRR